MTPVDTDRYGRTVAHVRCDGVHVNWRQVEDGLAWCFTQYLKQADVGLPMEKAAREARRDCGESRTGSAMGFRSAKRVTN